ncbi:MAG: PIN domain nuclease [Deltaproteobacteria bacterium]|nr:PIN domain nuclease [Deltaproteobacteria bacterium]
MILVDTSVWIDFLQGRDTAYRYTLHRLIEGEEDTCLTGIVLTEILQGIKDDKEAREITEDLLAFPIYNPTGIDTYIEAANIYRQCMKKGKTVRKTIDCLIAAIAIENNLTLFHNDKDFSSIEQCTELKTLNVIA